MAIIAYLRFGLTEDVTADKLYSYQPVEIPLGHVINSAARARNEGDSSLSVTIMSELLDPRGVSKGKQSRTVTLPPGTAALGQTKNVTLDRGGDWLLHATLHSGGSLLDEWTSIVITVPGGNGPPVDGGHIWVEKSYVSDYSEIVYQPDFPLEGPSGTEVYGKAMGFNDSSSSKSLKITCELIDPDGIARGARSFTGSIPPSAYRSGVTYDVVLDKKGDWKFHVLLESEGEKLDEEEWYAIYCTTDPEPPPEPTEGWEVVKTIDFTLKPPEGPVPPPITCLVDADCGENEVCEEGKCVCAEGYERNEEGKCVKKGAFPWGWLIAAAAIIGAAALWPKKDK